MKLAFVTEDEQTISAHFGGAPKVVVVTVEDGHETRREVRARAAHPDHESHDHDHTNGGHEHHHNPVERFAALSDCNVLVTRGLGTPAYDYAQSVGIAVYVTGIHTINEALAAFLAGKLDHDARRMHHH